ncbi:PglZ domain-containing protein [Roseococcus pinisoli]|uniref:PglZ domain-containing protein n=1 Tax=Roseococcus pinisoli TaxID=2835040 RepID=UPI001BCBE610|nr:PglZ domain-containing protein [Roseococcus pinisoli]
MMAAPVTPPSHPLHAYIAGQIAGYLKDRRIVVIYDPREELRPFFSELSGNAPPGILVAVLVGTRPAKLCVFDGSFFQVRLAVEPITEGETPEETVIYVPGCDRDDDGSLLMELEKAGTCYRPPALRQFARNVLRRRTTDVAIDAMLRAETLTYSDLARMAADEGEVGLPPLLRGMFGGADSQTILASWIAETGRDAEIETKGAVGELRDIIRAKIGLVVPDDAALPRMRAITARHLLANEFRLDLAGEAPSGGPLGQVQGLESKDQEKTVREVARRLRERHPETYIGLADRVEGELGLLAETFQGAALGAIDTFRFEERSVLAACFALVASDRFEEARALLDGREHSFWIDRDVLRKTLWEACRLMIELGLAAMRAGVTIAATNDRSADWVQRYVEADQGWYRLDRAQRRLETIAPEVEEEMDERALARVRAIYDDVVRRMAEGFLKALDKDGWMVPDTLHQTRIWSEVVVSCARPVAYVLVDAMRYEIGIELFERIERFGEVRIRPAIAALPSITPVGMAALLPGASADFSIVTQGARFGAKVGGSFLPDLSSRQALARAQVPCLVDLSLDEALSGNAKSLQKKIADAKVVIIRSAEIDGAGENSSTLYARAIMERAVEDIARCLQRLAASGIQDVVVAADHGHLFFAADREAAMRLEAPGGDTVDLHRRCWIGRGGATPPGSIRVQGARLGYATDLDVVVPASTSVFKAGGSLAYHHGGASLQELVIPVLTVKLKARAPALTEKNAVTVTHDFDAVTNRIFSLHIELGSGGKGLFDAARTVRPVVLAGERIVAKAGVAVGAVLEDGRLTLEPGKRANVGFILTDDTVTSVRIQILDAETDAVLYTSAKEVPVRLGV